MFASGARRRRSRSRSRSRRGTRVKVEQQTLSPPRATAADFHHDQWQRALKKAGLARLKAKAEEAEDLDLERFSSYGVSDAIAVVQASDSEAEDPDREQEPPEELDSIEELESKRLDFEEAEFKAEDSEEVELDSTKEDFWRASKFFVELLRWNLHSVSIDKIWNTFASVDSVLHAGQTKLGRSKQFLKRVLWNSTRREGEEFVNYFCFAVIRDDSFHVPDSIEDFVKVLDIFESPGQPCSKGPVPKRRQLGLLTPVAKRKAGKAGKGSKGSKGSPIGSRFMTPVAKRKGGKPGKGSKSRVARESRPWRSSMLGRRADAAAATLARTARSRRFGESSRSDSRSRASPTQVRAARHGGASPPPWRSKMLPPRRFGESSDSRPPLEAPLAARPARSRAPSAPLAARPPPRRFGESSDSRSRAPIGARPSIVPAAYAGLDVGSEDATVGSEDATTRKGSKSRVARESRPWRSKAKSSSGSKTDSPKPKANSPKPKATLPLPRPTSWPVVVGRVAPCPSAVAPRPVPAPCPAAGSAPHLAAGSAPAKAPQWAPPPPCTAIVRTQRRT